MFIVGVEVGRICSKGHNFFILYLGLHQDTVGLALTLLSSTTNFESKILMLILHSRLHP